MRKLMMLVLLTITTAVMAASVKVKADFKKGDCCVYQITQTTSSVNPMGQNENMTFVGEIKYDVTDVRPDGYTLEMKTLKFEDTNPGADNFTKEVALAGMKMLENQTVIAKTDKDGKILEYVNFEEIKSNTAAFVDQLADKLFEGKEEQLQGVMDKETLKKAILNEVTEEKLLSSLGNSYFGFYGKTISTGMMEDSNFSGLKFKTTYLVPSASNADGYTIKSTSVASMSKEDMKKMILEQVEKMLPADQADMVKENIDMVLESGVMKMDGSKQDTYEFLNSGWLKSAVSTAKISVMGMETNIETKTAIKECSWK